MECKIIFANKKLKETLENLKYEDKRLFKEIENALKLIKNNAFFGRNVRKNLFQKS